MIPSKLSIAVIALAAAVPSGCAAPRRNPVPGDLVDSAAVPGMPAIRHWGDEASPQFYEMARRAAERERADLAERGSGPDLPRADYLALSGGGQNGAFAAGLLNGWTEAGDRPAFKVVTGISTGALIAPFAFLGPEYDGGLKELYTTSDTKDLLEAEGPLNLLYGEAMNDGAPLARLIERYVDESFLARVAQEHGRGRLLLVSTTNLDQRRPVIWDMGAIASSGHPDAPALFRAVMLASASIPGIFPPVMIQVEADGERYDEMHVDGGTVAQVFVYPPALSLRRLAEDLQVVRERRAFIVRNARVAPTRSPVKRRTLDIMGSAIATLIRTQGIGDLYRIYAATVRDDIDYNLAVVPADFEAESHEQFDPDYMKVLFEVGRRMGSEGYPWLKHPPGFQAESAGE